MNKKNKVLRSTIIILLIFLSLIKVSCSSIKPVEKNNFLTINEHKSGTFVKMHK